MFTEEKRTSCWVSASRCCCCCCYFLSLKFFFYFLFILACASMSPGAIHCTSHVDILFSFVVPLYMAEHTESTISISAKFLFVSMKRTPGNAIKLEDVMIKITPRGCGNFSFLFFSGFRLMASPPISHRPFSTNAECVFDSITNSMDGRTTLFAFAVCATNVWQTFAVTVQW